MKRDGMTVQDPDVGSLLNAIYAFEVADHSAWLAGVGAAAGVAAGIRARP